MAWELPQPTLTARVTNDDLVGSIYRRDGDTYVRLRVEADDGQGGTRVFEQEMLLSATSLSGAQQTAFVQSWLTIRDDILPSMGFADV